MHRILSLTPSPNVDGNEAAERTFDFSNFPNLQGLDFRIGWVEGGLRWLPMAISTLDAVTSPYLSVIWLDFSRLHIIHRHWGQGPVSRSSTLQICCKEMDDVLNSGSSTRLYGMCLTAALCNGAVRGQPVDSHVIICHTSVTCEISLLCLYIYHIRRVNMI